MRGCLNVYEELAEVSSQRYFELGVGLHFPLGRSYSLGPSSLFVTDLLTGAYSKEENILTWSLTLSKWKQYKQVQLLIDSFSKKHRHSTKLRAMAKD